MEKTKNGFSLIELMITIAIAGVLSAIAIPSYTTLMANGRASTYANQLVSDLRYARSLAILENDVVSVCQTATAGSTTCIATTWQVGWSVTSANTGLRRNFQFNSALTAVSNEGITLSGGPSSPSYFAFTGNGMPSPVPTTASPYIFYIKPTGCTSGYMITIPTEGQITQATTPCP